MKKIGYKRLRMESNNEKTSDQISLSMEESNKLRSKLDQAPLRETTEGQSEKKQREAIHATDVSMGSEEETKKRIEKAKLIFCKDNDARLCTKSELEVNCTAGSGCMHDNDHIWSSTSF